MGSNGIRQLLDMFHRQFDWIADGIFLIKQASKKGDEKRLATIEQLKNLPVPESKLDKRIQDLIQLVCNVQAMEEALLEMKFDARKNPLGKGKFLFFFY